MTADTPARQPHPQRCEKIADRNDIIAFMKFAGFDVELAERTDGVEELTITGFDDTGDSYMLEFTSITPAVENHCDKCDHWDMCEGCPYTDERATHTGTPAPDDSDDEMKLSGEHKDFVISEFLLVKACNKLAFSNHAGFALNFAKKVRSRPYIKKQFPSKF